MIADERYREIMTMLKRDGVVKTQDLIDHFGVSRETVRRDFEHLESEGLLKRVYGGATLVKPNRGVEPPYTSREHVNPDAKRAIGRACAELIRDGDTVLLDVGATVLEVARNIAHRQNLTVITNSLRAANALVSQPSIHVYLLGGAYRDGEFSTSGHIAQTALEDFHVDKAIIGAGGITLEEGVTDFHEPEARLRRMMAERADQVIVVADHSKFGIVALIKCLPPKMIDLCVTDSGLPEEVAQQFEAKGIGIIREQVNP